MAKEIWAAKNDGNDSPCFIDDRFLAGPRDSRPTNKQYSLLVVEFESCTDLVTLSQLSRFLDRRLLPIWGLMNPHPLVHAGLRLGLAMPCHFAMLP